jgi:hypothetical protein
VGSPKTKQGTNTEHLTPMGISGLKTFAEA